MPVHIVATPNCPFCSLSTRESAPEQPSGWYTDQREVDGIRLSVKELALLRTLRNQGVLALTDRISAWGCRWSGFAPLQHGPMVGRV